MFWRILKRITPLPLKHKIKLFLRRVLLKIIQEEAISDNAVLFQQFSSLESKVASLQYQFDLRKKINNQDNIIEAFDQKLGVLEIKVRQVVQQLKQDNVIEVFDQKLGALEIKVRQVVQQLNILEILRQELVLTDTKLNTLEQSFADIESKATKINEIETKYEQIGRRPKVFTDQEYDAYEDKILIGRLEKQEDYFDMLIQECKEGAVVLDLGCGKGRFIDKVISSGREAFGIDMNAKYAPHANIDLGKLPEALFAKASESIDNIFSFHLIEHIPLNDLRRMLEESYRILNREGKIYLETPNVQSLFTISHYYFRDPTHLMPRHPAFYMELLSIVGFKNLELRPLSELDNNKKEFLIDPSIFNEDSLTLVNEVNKQLHCMHQLFYAGSGNILLVGEK